jgi:PEP-CTERM motif
MRASGANKDVHRSKELRVPRGNSKPDEKRAGHENPLCLIIEIFCTAPSQGRPQRALFSLLRDLFPVIELHHSEAAAWFILQMVGGSSMKIRTILVLLAFGVLSASARADDITVSNGSSAGWVQISPNTFGLPADLSDIGCGTENETSCEPMGVFNFNVGFSSSGIINILDSSGAPSDQLHFFNDANGHGVVTFISDPSLTNLLPGGTTLCTESTSGCVASFPITAVGGSVITINAASDDEAIFDPFGLGADTSDQIQIKGATIVSTPEPASFALLGTGLLTLVGLLRRKQSL